MTQRIPLGAVAPQQVCEDGSCPVSRAVAVLDGKWTLLVIRDLVSGPKRFGRLRTSLQGISPKTLTDRLRDLETAGLVTRTLYPQIPPRVEYELTERGMTLLPLIQALEAFGRTLAAPPPANQGSAPDGRRVSRQA